MHRLAARKDGEMAAETIARMTPSEFEETLGDPDEGLEIRNDVRDRLLHQRQGVAAGQHGQSFDDVVRQMGLE